MPYRGSYVSASPGFRVTTTAGTLVGYVGTDQTKLTAIAAIAAIDAMTAMAGRPTDVTVVTERAGLMLTVPGYDLTFHDDGPATTFPAPSPTTRNTAQHS
jgi:hypothetical protein